MPEPRRVEWSKILTDLWLSPTSNVDVLLHIASLGGSRMPDQPNIVAIGPYEILLAALHPKAPEYVQLNDPEASDLKRLRERAFENKLQKEQIERQAISVLGQNFLEVNLNAARPKLFVGAQFEIEFTSRLGSAFGSPRQLTIGLLLDVVSHSQTDAFEQQLRTLYFTPSSLRKALGHPYMTAESPEFSISGSATGMAPASAMGSGSPKASPSADDEPPPAAQMGNDVPPQEDWREDLYNTTSGPVPDDEVAAGKALAIEREADRFVLNVDTYAEALATVFRQATGEFCFAIFGTWGRGKTLLSRRLEERLRLRANEQEPHITYEVVRFSAWKYKRTPEAWFFLYETLAERFKSTDPWTRTVRFVRERTARLGRWGVVLRLAALLLATLPFSAYFNIFGALAPLLGIAGFVYLTVLLVRAAPKIGVLSRWYGRLADHKVRLGIQAVVGDDLRSLILGWIPVTVSQPPAKGMQSQATLWQSFERSAAAPILALLIAAGIWHLVISDPFQFGRAIFTNECLSDDSVGALCRFVSSVAAPATTNAAYLVLTMWTIAAALVVCTVHWPLNDVDRILLIIDDLTGAIHLRR